MQILDVGCGTAKHPGAVGLDIVELPGVDIVHDCRVIPWPIESESFDEVRMLDIIEHLPDTIAVMEEVFRILRPGGHLYVVTAPWNSRYAFSDPTHRTFFSEITWEFFTEPARRPYYTDVRFEMVEFRYTFDAVARRVFRSERLMRRLAYFLNNIIDGMHVTLRKPMP